MPHHALPRRGRVAALLGLAALTLASCRSGPPASDAYGTFEATEVVVAAEVGGRLLHLSVEEGQYLEAGRPVGVVDTTQLVLQRAQIQARREAARARLPGLDAELAVLEAQREVAEKEWHRLQNLVAAEAAPRQQLDDVEGQLRVLERRMASVRAQRPALLGEVAALDAQIAQIQDQIARSVIVNPVAGTVLVTFAEAHELTTPGRPLYRLAPLDTLYLRAYVSGAQLPHVRLGQPVTVLIDETATDNRALPGTITWIASEAEFTPRFIQTKEERVNLVYAVRVRVPNPRGALKIGMPGEVRFDAP
ncbi:MAG: HlyD family efflux transporter periplasmic adaptor subunit [Bacteroidetes bacterium]|nr:MAG: HlyD family efflux transporter periplasmic adaptor subunit [Bacteroidota bacterium]